MTPNSSDSLSRSMQWSIVCNTKLSEHRKYKVSSTNTAENVIQDTQCYSLCARAAVTCRLKSIQQTLSQIVGQMICNNLFQKFGNVRQVWNRAVIPGVVWIKPWCFFFKQRPNDSTFEGLWNCTGRQTGVGDIENGCKKYVQIVKNDLCWNRLQLPAFGW